MAELKRCGHCKGEAEVEKQTTENHIFNNGETKPIYRYRPKCLACRIGSLIWYSTLEAAITAWNRRDGEEELGKYLVELWDTVEEAHKIIETEWQKLPKDVDIRSDHPANGWMMNWYMTMETIPIYRFKEYKEADHERD